MRVTIPKNDDEARQVADVATMNGWALAGYVASQVVLDNPAGRPGRESVRSDRFLTPAEFAAKGIRGLRSKNTVQLYAERWAEAGLPVPEPGQVIDVGDREWPPTGGTDWGRAQKDPERRDAIQKAADEEDTKPDTVARVAASPKAIAAAIKADPKARQAAAKAVRAVEAEEAAQEEKVLVEKYGEMHFTDDDLERVQSRRSLEAVGHFHTAIEHLTDAIRCIRDLPLADYQRESFLRSAEQIRTLADTVRDLVEGRGLDAELAALLDNTPTE